jgi:hypothetical protein
MKNYKPVMSIGEDTAKGYKIAKGVRLCNLPLLFYVEMQGLTHSLIYVNG